MSEPQYSGYKKMPRHIIGVMANQVWHDDPKMLGIRLARYKFVAKMLAGKNKVAEIGSGDGWFSRVVAKEVKNLSLFDFDKSFVDDFYSGNPAKNTKAYVHDILHGPLEYGFYNAVYSLDCLEHFEYKKQKIFMQNLCSSLGNHGCAIIGMPSLESQQYASPASKVGHIGCLAQDELKELMSEYFYNVFLLGMNDESIHTGFGGMCHYHLAVCANVR